jgi:uncharacterized protein
MFSPMKRSSPLWIFALLFFAVVNVSAAADLRLVEAVRSGDGAAIRSLLNQRLDVNAAQLDGTTALHWAAYRDDAETARLLVRAGANVKAANRYGLTPLGAASTNGNPAIIELLVKAGANPNTVLPDGETVLMQAARSGNAGAVKLLLSSGADVNARESFRDQTALMWAAAEGHAEVLQVLLAHGANIHARSKIEFVPAEAQFRQNEEQHGGFTALLFAAREGRIDAVQTLLKAGANINDSLLVTRNREAKPDNGVNVFLLAVANAHYELAARLLEWGVDPNTAPLGWTALHQLSWVRKADDAGHTAPPPEGSGNMSSFEFARTLVKRGANVNARATVRRSPAAGGLNMTQATPFMMAARTKDAAYMRLLAELGADPLLPNVDNTTPLMAAAGIGVNSLDDGETENQLLQAVETAIALGNDINAVDNNGETAMHGAAYKLVPALVQLLADKGARIEIWNRPNKKGETPLQIAMKTKSNKSALDSPRTVAAIREVLTKAGVATPAQ